VRERDAIKGRDLQRAIPYFWKDLGRRESLQRPRFGC
jgi:hypothetical protein